MLLTNSDAYLIDHEFALDLDHHTIQELKDSYKIDFLISKPSDKTHFKEFDKALKIIESAKIQSNFSFEDEWNQYINQNVEKAEELETS